MMEDDVIKSKLGLVGLKTVFLRQNQIVNIISKQIFRWQGNLLDMLMQYYILEYCRSGFKYKFLCPSKFEITEPDLTSLKSYYLLVQE